MRTTPKPMTGRSVRLTKQVLTLTMGLAGLTVAAQAQSPLEEVFFRAHRFELFQPERDPNHGTAYELMGRWGSTADRFVLKADGEQKTGLSQARTELLWSHALDPVWDIQVGPRVDQSRSGEYRQWLGLGLQGLVPDLYNIEITGYARDHGSSAMRLSAEYDLELLPKLVLQPRVEMNFFGQPDVRFKEGMRLSQSAVGLRLRFGFSRHFAPYVGVESRAKYGSTALLARLNGEPIQDTRWLLGVRIGY